jgi:hypothetical protein
MHLSNNQKRGVTSVNTPFYRFNGFQSLWYSIGDNYLIILMQKKANVL